MSSITNIFKTYILTGDRIKLQFSSLADMESMLAQLRVLKSRNKKMLESIGMPEFDSLAGKSIQHKILETDSSTGVITVEIFTDKPVVKESIKFKILE